MPRCVSCNCILSTQEMSIKGTSSKQYLDLCYRCVDLADISYESDTSLSNNDAPEEFDLDEEYQDKDYED